MDANANSVLDASEVNSSQTMFLCRDSQLLSLNIGDTINGGIIFYLDSSKQHGLICAFSNDKTSTTFGSIPNNSIKGDGNGAGYMNTIFWRVNTGYSTRFVNYQKTYGNKTFGDWYWPSLYELQIMYSVKNQLGISIGIFWSSTQDQTGTLQLDFSNGNIVTINHYSTGNGYTLPISRF